MKEMSFHRHSEKRFTQRSAYNFRTLEINDLKIVFRENNFPIQCKNSKTCQEQHWKLRENQFQLTMLYPNCHSRHFEPWNIYFFKKMSLPLVHPLSVTERSSLLEGE